MALSRTDLRWMRMALRLAQRGEGCVAPNPMVGAVIVRGNKLLGKGYHQRAGLPHAEVEAIQDAARRRHSLRNATLFVTLEPCCTHGRTPPCTEAILQSGIRRVVVAAQDPNPKHAGRGLRLLRRAGVEVEVGLLAEESERLNEAFNHWITQRTPFVLLKAAMTLDGKIATRSGDSKWITGELARAHGMKLRYGADAILVGVNTVLEDDPQLTLRPVKGLVPSPLKPRFLRVVVDSRARTPLASQLVRDQATADTLIVVTRRAPAVRLARLRKKVEVWVAPVKRERVDLAWLMKRLGARGITRLLVEGGGEVHGSFLFSGLAHRAAFYYAPMVVGGRSALRAVAGMGASSRETAISLRAIEWCRVGADLFLSGRIGPE